MEPFTQHTGLVATLDRANVDTDQIIPKQFLKRIERSGFGQYLFFDWRFNQGAENPDFELNRPEVRKATILVAGSNFGSGSSREHAVWSLADYGFRVVIALSFGDIFYNNCFKNGLLPVVCEEPIVHQILRNVHEHPGYRLSVDLESLELKDDRGLSVRFQVDEFRRHCLLHGRDDITITLDHVDKIDAYESRRGLA